MRRPLYAVLISAALVSAKDDEHDDEGGTRALKENIFHEEEIPHSSAFLDIFRRFYKPKGVVTKHPYKPNGVVIKHPWPLPTDPDPSATTTETTEECKDQQGSAQRRLPLCAGIRGNGPRLWAHFPALARAVEAFGPFSGIAGGSSGTVTSIILESIMANPLIVQGDGAEQRARISFLLKTLEEIPRVTLIDPTELLMIIWTQIVEQEINQRILSDDPEVQAAALEDLLALFALPDVAPLVNPDLIDLLLNSPDPVFHASDILNATARLFDIGDDFLVFIRSYILNFAALADIVDNVASFYSGYEPVDIEKFNVMLNDCALPSVGKDWEEVQDFETSIEVTCGELFMSLYQTFLVVRDASHPKRIDDSLGDTLKTIINIGVLRDDAVDKWKKAVEDYGNVVPVDFDVDFDDVDFGYYGDQETLDEVSKNHPILFQDLKSNKFSPLGPTTWRKVLQQSPAEPNLSRGVPIMNNTKVSVAGWTDPTPGQVLTSMGCDRVILINAPGGVVGFILNVAKLLGASPEEVDALFSLDDDESGFVTALREADATYCINWDSPPLLDFESLADEGYIGPLLSDDACILSLDVEAVDEDILGCTP